MNDEPLHGNAYRDDKIHVCRQMCDTCIFHPDNRMLLEPGRIKALVEGALKAQSAIICHETLEGDHAICRGFYDRHETTTLQIARRLGVIREVDIRTKVPQ